MDIYLTDADGDDERLLTDNEVGDGSPRWSPDGDKIAFVSNRAPSARCQSHDCTGYTNELYVMDNDGSDVTRLTETLDEEGSPAWSPDGTRIMFSRFLDAREGARLWMVNGDGTCPRPVSMDAGSGTSPDWYGPSDARTPNATPSNRGGICP